MDGGIVRVVVNEDCLDVEKPASNVDAIVVVEAMSAPVGPRFTDLWSQGPATPSSATIIVACY